MGSGRVYLPNFPQSRPLRVQLTSPARKMSVYDLNGDTVTEADKRKPKLLRHMVHQEELRDIVSRLTRPTMASKMRAVNFRPETQYTYVDMGSYRWSTMPIYTDYQKHMYNNNGSVRSGFKRTVKANYRPFG